MALILPTSFGDLDWTEANIRPLDWRYAYSLREAILERATALRDIEGAGVPEMSPGMQSSMDTLRALQAALVRVGIRYYRTDGSYMDSGDFEAQPPPPGAICSSPESRAFFFKMKSDVLKIRRRRVLLNYHGYSETWSNPTDDPHRSAAAAIAGAVAGKNDGINIGNIHTCPEGDGMWILEVVVGFDNDGVPFYRARILGYETVEYANTDRIGGTLHVCVSGSQNGEWRILIDDNSYSFENLRATVYDAFGSGLSEGDYAIGHVAPGASIDALAPGMRAPDTADWSPPGNIKVCDPSAGLNAGIGLDGAYIDFGDDFIWKD